jgi:polar amino acid transport system substrate-binding protein
VDGRHYAGFDVDILHALSYAIWGSFDDIRFVPVSQEYRMGSADQGIVDVVANSITILCSRTEQVQFSVDYLDAGEDFLVPAGNPDGVSVSLDEKRRPVVTTDLKVPLKTCTVGTTTSADTLTALAVGGKITVVTAGNWSDCLVLLQQGRVGAISTDDTILGGIEAEAPYLVLAGKEFTVEPHGLAFPKFTGKNPTQASPSMPPDNTEFVSFANGVIRDLEDSKSTTPCPEPRLGGESCWSAMYRTWVAPQLGPPGPTHPGAPTSTFQTYSPPPTQTLP